MTPPEIKVLLIDDDEDDFIMIRDLLAEVPFTKFKLEWVSEYEAAKAKIRLQRHDVCLMDYRLGAHTGLELIKEVGAEGGAPMILLTGYRNDEVDLEAMKIGAADYLVKGQISSSLLERSIRYSIYRAQVVETLREREESFRSLLDSTFEGIIVHDNEGKILEVNQEVVRIFDRDQKSTVGANIRDLCGADCASEALQMTGEPGEATKEALFTRDDGSVIHVEIASKPYLYKGSAVRLTAIRDITMRKQMEAQILQQDRLASIGLLASSLAHEIGTPLGVIRGRAEIMANQIQDNPALKRGVDVIVSQIDRVSKLIRALLSLARGERATHLGAVALPRVIGDVLDLLGHEFKKHTITVENELAERADVLVTAEGEPLHQVFLNLLVNAVHAIESASKHGREEGHRIRVASEDAGDSWIIAIEDSGCGISQENMRHLFKPFFTTKDIGVGTGLGLATSYRIIQSWGGSITVESRENVGTTFRITLPKAKPATETVA